jgi:hypothetical protein
MVGLFEPPPLPFRNLAEMGAGVCYLLAVAALKWSIKIFFSLLALVVALAGSCAATAVTYLDGSAIVTAAHAQES